MLSEQLSKIGSPLICPIAAIVRDGSILRGLRNYTPDKWKAISVWTMPGGRCEMGESVEDALRREVREEIGVDDLKVLDFIGEVPGVKEGDTVPIFFCNADQEPQLMEPDKFSEWRWVPLEEYFSETNLMNPAAHEVITSFLKKLVKA